MIALLGLISTKDWVYLGVILSLLVGAGAYTVHERHVGEAKIVAADRRAALVAQAKDKAIEVAETNALTNAGAVYEKAVTIPPVGDLGLECVRNIAPSRGQVSAPAGGAAPGATQTVDGGSGSTFDPSGELLTRARQADAQITYLQSEIAALRKAMEDAP
jgi:hypothetical protein